MKKDTFTKRWDPEHGFNNIEAAKKKAAVDEAYGVNSPDSKWKPAEIVPDPNKKDGYMVTIERID